MGVVYSGTEKVRENRSVPVGTRMRVASEMCLSMRLALPRLGSYSMSFSSSRRRARKTCGTLCPLPSTRRGEKAVTPPVPPKYSRPDADRAVAPDRNSLLWRPSEAWKEVMTPVRGLSRDRPPAVEIQRFPVWAGTMSRMTLLASPSLSLYCRSTVPSASVQNRPSPVPNQMVPSSSLAME